MRLLLVLLTVLEATAWTARTRELIRDNRWKEVFPPYGCETNPAASPYRLEGSYTSTSTSTGQRVCVRGAAVQACNPKNPCCSLADFYKLELRVNPKCNHAMKSVTLNGRPAAVPTFELFGAASNQALLKVPRLNLTRENVTSAIICFTLRNPCPTMAALCPEGDGRCTYTIVQSGNCDCCPVGTIAMPPPPSPPALPSPPLPPPPIPPTSAPQFPFTSPPCDTTPGMMPFAVTGPPTVIKTAANNNKYCWVLEAAQCAEPGGSCCQQDELSKVELWSYDVCRSSVVAAFIGPNRYPPTWDQGGTLRLARLAGITSVQLAAAAVPQRLCVELQAGSACSTLDRFCYGPDCRVALFGAAAATGRGGGGASRCCPTSSVPESNRRLR